MEAIHYAIEPVNPGAHLFAVTLWIAHPDPAGQKLSLPVWIPGSYLIREFARHIDSLSIERRAQPPQAPGMNEHDGHVGKPAGRTQAANRSVASARRGSAQKPSAHAVDAGVTGGQAVAFRKIDKNTWQCAPLDQEGDGLLVRYQVYAWDLSVRAAHLDDSHGFFNASSVFLCVRGQEDAPCTVDILPPAGEAFTNWRVATTLPVDRQAGTPIGSFGRYRADDYDALVDHPVEMGTFQSAHFEAGGCRHEIAITGRADVDLKRLVQDLKPICQQQIELFEPRTKRAPNKRYLFMTMAVGDGYGGLEHRDSTALICSRQDLPWPGMQGTPENYQTFLGLASHEYFHTWHVKRIKPVCFDPYDLDREVHTRLLWVFEGFTSYYDDLMLVRSGVIGRDDYLRLMTQNIQRVATNPGRHLQSVAESSFDAWIKYYRPDENTPNAVSSYYVKGALVALCLDLTIRSRTGSRKSLDDVMRLMWQRYGRDFQAGKPGGRGIGEDEMPALVREATGLDLSRQMAAWAYGTEELPLARCLKPFGIRLKQERSGQQGWLGARTGLREGEVTLLTVERDGPAARAGLSAGDRLVAIDGLRCTEASLRMLLSRRTAGERIEVVSFRRDELRTAHVTLGQTPGEIRLQWDESSNRERDAWLGQQRGRRMTR